MEDRKPTKPGRIKLVDEETGRVTYAYMERADEPVTKGTPLCKRTLLTDDTALFLGLDPLLNPTVDQALRAAVLAAKGACMVTVKVTVAGRPARAGVQVLGLSGMRGGGCFTDAAGVAAGFSTEEITTLATPDYLDLAAASVTVATPMLANVSASLALGTPKAGSRDFTRSAAGFRFSPYASGVDVCCVGGGSGGECGYLDWQSHSEDYYGWGGAGGNRGQVVNGSNLKPDVTKTYDVTVGEAGIGGSAYSRLENQSPSGQQQAATRGGDSSFLDVTARGGYDGGGAGAIAEASGAFWRWVPSVPGASSTVRKFGEAGGQLLGGAGGGSGIAGTHTGSANVRSGSSGGAPFGGAGADGRSEAASWGGNAAGYGGGGGGGFNPTGAAIKCGGDGYQGAVFVRWRVVG